MHDSPASSYASSSTPPSPQKQHSALHRSYSPIPHISTFLPSHDPQYSPSSRAADISRLLDPAYSSASSSSTAASRAYVDHRGDLHDPDYRDFPILRPTTRSKSTAPNRKNTSSSGSRSPSVTRVGRTRYSTRPGWEREWMAEAEEAEGAASDDEDDDEDGSQSHFSPFATRTRLSQPRRTSQPPSTYAYAPRYSYYLDEHMPIAASPAGSYEESNMLHERDFPFNENNDEERSKLRRNSLLRRHSKKNASTPSLREKRQEEEEQADKEERSQQVIEAHEFVPSCNDVLRQQWQAVVLRFRFSVFHAKRRLRRISK